MMNGISEEKRFSRPCLQELDEVSGEQPSLLVDKQAKNIISHPSEDGKLIQGQNGKSGGKECDDSMQQQHPIDTAHQLRRHRFISASTNGDVDDEESESEDTIGPRTTMNTEITPETVADSTTSNLSHDIEQQQNHHHEEQVAIQGAYLAGERSNRRRIKRPQELIEGRNVEGRQCDRTIAGLLVVLLFAATGLILSLIFVVFKEEEQQINPMQNVSQTLSTTDNPSVTPTLIPTSVTPTKFPSFSPTDTQAPTLERLGMILNEVRRQFQTSTLEEDLLSRSSSQYKAALWMAEKDILSQVFQFPLTHTDENAIVQFRQRYALATLYYSTNGDEWLDQCNFMNVFLHVCDWNCPWPIETNPQIAEYVEYGYNFTDVMGIDCWDEALYVILIDFAFNNLSGTLPEEMQGIDPLIGLRLPSNRIQGTIPFDALNNTLFQRKNGFTVLTRVHLYDNQFTGTIQEGINSLTSLRGLSLESNLLSGTIPSSIANLTNLNLLGLGGNVLSGTIPANLFQMENLFVMFLFENMLSGALPEEIRLPSLSKIYLRYNGLSGSIPEAIGNSTNLRYMEFDNNNFTGTILPTSMGELTSLTTLLLCHNQLTGEALNPSILVKLKNIQHLCLGDNHIRGRVPREIDSLSSLRWLDVGHSPDYQARFSMTGRLPRQLGSLQYLTSLVLTRNSIGGTIPTEIGNLLRLEHLSLSYNPLTGTLPTELSALPNLGSMYIEQTDLVGDLTSLCENLPETTSSIWKSGFKADCLEEDEIRCCCCLECCDNSGDCGTAPICA